MRHHPGLGVLYSLSGRSHLSLLLVSLCSLHKHYSGPVAVVACDEVAFQELTKLGRQPLIGKPQLIDAREHHRGSSGWRERAWAGKTLLPAITPFARTVYLDADTVVAGPFDELVPDAETPWIFTATPPGWTTLGPRLGRQIGHWRAVAPQECAAALSAPFPVINTGVFAWHGAGGEWASRWRRLTLAHGSRNDNSAAQLIYRETTHRLLDFRYNAHPGTSRKLTARGADVRIWHGCARSFFRNRGGRLIWFRALAEAAAWRIGNLDTAIVKATTR